MANFGADGRTTVVISNGASLSEALACSGYRLASIQMPAAWTAAVLTFQVSYDRSTYGNLYDDAGSEYQVTVDVSRSVALDPFLFSGATHVKLRSGTAAAAVAQGAERTLTVAGVLEGEPWHS
jgi:hypothetical protein